MYKCIAIDDEPHAIEGIKKYVEKTGILEMVAFFTDPIKAMSEIQNFAPVDIIFLDVDMPEISGIELATEVRKHTKKIIFTTAHTKYGYEAFEVKANGYLLKPYSFVKFLSTVNSILPSTELQEMEKETFFFIKSKEDNLKLMKVEFDDVIAVESKLNYIQLHTKIRSILSYMSLTEIYAKLSSEMDILQYQRSFIINKKYIEHIEGNTIKMTNGLKITVGEYYRKDFSDFIAKNIIKPRRKN